LAEAPCTQLFCGLPYAILAVLWAPLIALLVIAALGVLEYKVTKSSDDGASATLEREPLSRHMGHCRPRASVSNTCGGGGAGAGASC
jgi:hypothetical protein